MRADELFLARHIGVVAEYGEMKSFHFNSRVAGEVFDRQENRRSKAIVA